MSLLHQYLKENLTTALRECKSNEAIQINESINELRLIVAFIRKVAKEQDGTLLGNEASQLLAGMGELG